MSAISVPTPDIWYPGKPRSAKPRSRWLDRMNAWFGGEVALCSDGKRKLCSDGKQKLGCSAGGQCGSCWSCVYDTSFTITISGASSIEGLNANGTYILSCPYNSTNICPNSIGSQCGFGFNRYISPSYSILYYLVVLCNVTTPEIDLGVFGSLGADYFEYYGFPTGLGNPASFCNNTITVPNISEESHGGTAIISNP